MRKNGNTPLSPEARGVLQGASCAGNVVFLHSGQLDRALYEEVNEVLTRLGGKWQGGKLKGHVFPFDPAPLLQDVITSMVVPAKNPYDFFQTPKAVLDIMLWTYIVIDLLPDETRLLEPSAGIGAIVNAVREAGFVGPIDAVEIDPFRASRLKDCRVINGDFLAFDNSDKYDLVLMNPPFTSDKDAHAYISHITHAWDLLKPGGDLVSIVPSGFEYRQDKRVAEFRQLVTRCGQYDRLPVDSFKESGTGIGAGLIHMTKDAADWQPTLF